MSAKKGNEYWKLRKKHGRPKGTPSDRKGKTKRNYKVLKNISDKLKQKYKEDKNIKCGFKASNYKHTKEWYKEKSKQMKKNNPMKKLLKDKHPNWQGGISNEPYAFEFNKELKEKIKKRDKYRCQKCFKHQIELKKSLCIHHIDYNKKNCKINNLISLCKSCHTQTNWKRKDWEIYYKKRIGGLI